MHEVNDRDRPRKVQFSVLQKLHDLDFDFGLGRGHTGVHIWLRSTHHQIRSKSEKLCGRTDGWTHLSSNPGDDLKISTIIKSLLRVERWQSPSDNSSRNNSQKADITWSQTGSDPATR